jgi:hypothetical protein
MNMATLPPTPEPQLVTPFDRKQSYQMAFQATLQVAQRELILCENDFSESDLGNKICHNILWRFFTAPSPGQLKILLKNADYLAAHCPRLMQLRDQFGHRIEIRQLAESSQDFDQGFVIADRQYFLQRHHFSSYRGEYGENPRSVALLQHDFSLLWEQASPPDSLQRLYL